MPDWDSEFVMEHRIHAGRDLPYAAFTSPGRAQRLMMTLRLFQKSPPTIPADSAWHLALLSEARGRQELLLRQSPQGLKALREKAQSESIACACRLDGLGISLEQLQSIVAGAVPMSAVEREIHGFHSALTLVHAEGANLTVSEETIRRLHGLLLPEATDAGAFRATSHGFVDIGLPTIPAAEVPVAIAELISRWSEVVSRRTVHPFIAMAAFELDFLRIHPFANGNNRLACLLLLLLSYHVELEVGRFISLDRLIEQSRTRHDEAFRSGSLGWEEGAHDPWSFINYVLKILTEAYKELQLPAEIDKARKGAKTEMVLHAIQAQTDEFKLVDIERLCPGVGRDLIRTLLAELRGEGELTCKGRGPAARWRRSPKT
jgi:Fic family protein